MPVSLEEDSRRGPLKWLDAQVGARGLPVRIASFFAELDWIGTRNDLAKVLRMAPFVGERHTDPQADRAHVRSRMARWSQMRLARRELARAVTYGMLLFLRSGFAQRHVSRAWRRHSADHREGQTVRIIAAAFDRWADHQGPGWAEEGATSTERLWPPSVTRASKCHVNVRVLRLFAHTRDVVNS